MLSELQWEDVESNTVRLSYRASGGLKDRRVKAYLRLEAEYGWIYSGEVRDSDYAGDDRTLEFSRSNNQADKGDVVDVIGGIGPQLRSRGGNVKIMPLVGYAYHEQDLVLTDGLQTVSEQSIIDAVVGTGEIILQPVGPFPGLDSDYEAHWKGPWVGLDMEAQFGRWALLGGAEIHFMDYEAEAMWNLREDLAQPTSFEHEADGYGLVFSAQSSFALNERWRVLVEARYMDFWTDPGIDRIFHVDQTTGEVRVTETRLNEVNWQSGSASLGLVYRFE